ncbi:fungal-specific transcription factor domain-containing protein [Talaromyces proteolyticus]|uniref:Fungal-specific transcription factor domain-containing protein n=1 Tax=Talaromyces proteolyticus TaxID=1131652 RepID=A0AAD4KZV8_9EURO|nr:fungal-specific transcription factor domain-containing protein [Talaromyces proteolyticus]KAH8701501.1 fungal-specific transcription factor domain-containing protein [Talaromyces proteolyticus]
MRMQVSESTSPRVSEMVRELSRITKDIILDASDTFFLYCHNKPFYLFDPDLFQRKLTQSQIPVYLQLAFLASAIRYSSHSRWKWQRKAAIDNHARYSWAIIMSSPDAFTDICAVQALALLTIVDAIAGRQRAAWVKIGIAIRISQSLDMMLEPNADVLDAEQNERRHIFWSLYLIDKFVCCSFQRPPAMVDSDCLLYLPVDAQQYQQPNAAASMTLNTLLDNANSIKSTTLRPGWFGISVGIAAVLGKTVKFMMSNNDKENVASWNSTSEYGSIHADLDRFREIVSKDENMVLSTMKDRLNRNHERTAHKILSCTVYHLAHCLLDHPFLWAMKTLRLYPNPNIPHLHPSWIRKSLTSSLQHACSLTNLLVSAKSAGYVPIPSFYSYCMMVAGSIHALYYHCRNNRESSSEYLNSSIQYFVNLADLWDESPTLADGLRIFADGCQRYSDLLLCCDKQNINGLQPLDIEILKSMVDYWEVMNPRNLVSSLHPLHLASGSFDDKNNNEDILQVMSEDSSTFSRHQHLSDSIGDNIFNLSGPEELLGLEEVPMLPLDHVGFSDFLHLIPSPNTSTGTDNGGSFFDDKNNME